MKECNDYECDRQCFCHNNYSVLITGGYNGRKLRTGIFKCSSVSGRHLHKEDIHNKHVVYIHA